MDGRPFAVFDIDGTLIRWQLYHALADELAHRGLLDDARYQKVRKARMIWKTRSHQAAFHDYEEELVSLIDASISGITLEAFNQACRAVTDVYEDQVYTYTRNLIEQLKKDGYLLFAISASQVEIIGLIAEHYGFDDFDGTHYELKQGRFTGNKTVLKRGKKPEVLRQLVAKHSATWKESLGIGDSESDIPMLEIVERPVAFNPTMELFDHARENHWKVVVERKNVIYKMEDNDGPYQVQAS
jgi:HAD superfamily hydrolase (TIGR01490 family)